MSSCDSIFSWVDQHLYNLGAWSAHILADAYVLLKLFNKFRKRDKMRKFSGIYIFFLKEFINFNNTDHKYKIQYNT